MTVTCVVLTAVSGAVTVPSSFCWVAPSLGAPAHAELCWFDKFLSMGSHAKSHFLEQKVPDPRAVVMQITPVGLIPTHPGLKGKPRESLMGQDPFQLHPGTAGAPLLQVPDEYSVGKEIQTVWIIHKKKLEEWMDSFLH